MKPAPFEYVKPSSVDDALTVLTEGADDTQPIAGGQSLTATLNMRLSAPVRLVDLNGLEELRGITDAGGVVRIGALTRYRDLEQSDLVADHLPLIKKTLPLIAHPAIRNRGTLGGSIAFADPAAEMPACVTALNGAIEITGLNGVRKVAAGDFFKGLYETDLQSGELITAIELPKAAPGSRFAIQEFARRHGDYAMAGLVAAAQVDGATVSDIALVFFAMGGTPVAASSAAAKIAGKAIDADAIASAQAALDDDLDPFDDTQCSAAMKKHLARVLTDRVLTELAGG